MRVLHIYLRNIDEVKSFVNTINNIEGDVTLSEGRYVIDAKSIMGILRLNLSKKLEMTIKDWENEYVSLFERFQE